MKKAPPSTSLGQATPDAPRPYIRVEVGAFVYDAQIYRSSPLCCKLNYEKCANIALGRSMASLTSILPQIAPTLRMATSSLYQRQRALVKMKMLPTPQGRGRGSGAEATADTIALMLVSVLATDSLSETEAVVQSLAHAAYVDLSKKDISACPFTGKKTFVEALAFALTDEKVWKLKPSIVVSRDTLGAQIIWFRGRRADASYFGSRPEIMSNFVEREVRLHFKGLAKIREELHISQSALAAGCLK